MEYFGKVPIHCLSNCSLMLRFACNSKPNEYQFVLIEKTKCEFLYPEFVLKEREITLQP